MKTTPTSLLTTAFAATALVLGVTSCGKEAEPKMCAIAAPAAAIDYDNLTPEQEALLAAPPGVVYEEGALIIDARTQEEYDDDGHLPGAILIPHDTIMDKIADVAPDKDAKIYVHCLAGVRADITLNALKAAGYTHVFSLGGIDNAAKVTGKEIVK